MPFQLSPGVNVTEIDLTGIVPAVATSTGAIAGIFPWGPIGQRVLVDTENKLVSSFGAPTSNNAETFYTAANFLSYGNSLYVVRAANTTSDNTTIADVGSTENTAISVFNSYANTSALNSSLTVLTIATNTAVFTVGETVNQSNGSSNTANGVVYSTNSSYLVLSSAQGTFSNTYQVKGVTSSANATWSAQQTKNTVSHYVVLKNRIDYDTQVTPNSNGGYSSAINSAVQWVAKYGGAYGNSLRVSVCDTPNAYSSNINLYQLGANAGIGTNSVYGTLTIAYGESAANIVFTGTNSASYAVTVGASFANGDLVTVGNTTIGVQLMQVTSTLVTGSNVAINFSSACKLPTSLSLSNTVGGNSTVINLNRRWQYSTVVGSAPIVSDYQSAYGNSSVVDQIHVVVVDNGGVFSGTPGTILETFEGLSRATNSLTTGGASNYYASIINDSSKYIWWANDRTTAASGLAASLSPSTNSTPFSVNFVNGTDGYSESDVQLACLAQGYDLFGSTEAVDVSLIMQGKPAGGGTTSVNGMTVQNFNLANYIIDNICEARKDCIALISPDDGLIKSNAGIESTAIVNWRGAIHDSSYAVMDSGYKYQYDRYNDVYRWIPMNGDVAGLCVRTDNTRDPWWSPAGFNRGQIKNLVKLRFNPSKADRDLMYPKGINPVVTFPGQGTVLFGDKTCQTKPSAFDHINVRRLFIVLEKAIATAAKFFLFEFNDDFTRAQFKALVNPYLRDIQGRRGITDFLVVCDGTNNTAEVIDGNRFVGDIYIKPARSINYIQLNFVAVRTGVQFSEVVGKF
ncbi:tail sheath protein [uncultured Caudovirales phage]|uniref:Tail sheath protein n=1 Tax=uncultured Caudovirales phage TaxID=2100421 RepID=A0A6J5QIH9_9CAUD|nr:tail sheath protein [uncultured Caudovirales phage]